MIRPCKDTMAIMSNLALHGELSMDTMKILWDRAVEQAAQTDDDGALREGLESVIASLVESATEVTLGESMKLLDAAYALRSSVEATEEND